MNIFTESTASLRQRKTNFLGCSSVALFPDFLFLYASQLSEEWWRVDFKVMGLSLKPNWNNYIVEISKLLVTFWVTRSSWVATPLIWYIYHCFFLSNNTIFRVTYLFSVNLLPFTIFLVILILTVSSTSTLAWRDRWTRFSANTLLTSMSPTIWKINFFQYTKI